MVGMQEPGLPFFSSLAGNRHREREREREMDESWRVPIGSVVPRRRSAEQTRRSGGSLGADDFRDVFGGPPRSVVVRQFSGGDPVSPCSSAPYFLSTHFRDPQRKDWGRPPLDDPGKVSRKLPDFAVPVAAGGGGAGRWVVRTEEGFYNDILDSGGGEGAGRIRSRTRSWQSTSKSKSTSSSVLSSEDGRDSVCRLREPLALVDDAVLSSFASKLRPINVPCRRQGSSPSPTIAFVGEQSSSWSWKASTAPCPRPHLRESRLEGVLTTRPKVDDEPYNRRFPPFSPPSHAAVGTELEKPVAGDDDDSGSGGSPSSAVSSIYDDIPMATIVPLGAHERRLQALQELEKEVTVVLEDEEAEGGYGAIEIVPGGKAVDAAIEEAIAWAKERFRASSSSPEGDLDQHKQVQGLEREEEEEEREHVEPLEGCLLQGRRDEGLMLDVVTHLERLRGVWR